MIEISEDFPAGTVDLDNIDARENALIELNGTLEPVPREPDGLSWISEDTFATADEGDLDRGSRGFTSFGVDADDDGDGNNGTNTPVVLSSGNSLEHLVTRLGHYPEERSENEGNEPENVEYARYGDRELMFVGSERSSAVFVYDAQAFGENDADDANESGETSAFLQALPTGVGPEGRHAIPSRNLFVPAAEVDDRGGKIRSVISLYALVDDGPTNPTMLSADRPEGLPIPWGALSALAADPTDLTRVYTAHDSSYRQSRLYEVDVSEFPAVITDEIVLKDGEATVDLDIEGVAVSEGGGLRVVSEGSGTVDAPNGETQPINLGDLALR